MHLLFEVSTLIPCQYLGAYPQQDCGNANWCTNCQYQVALISINQEDMEDGGAIRGKATGE